MSQKLHIPASQKHRTAWEVFCSQVRQPHSRTSDGHWLLDPAATVVAVLTISILTVATIVLIVTTVANTGLLIQSHDDCWSRWNSSPPLRFGDNSLVPEEFAMTDEEQIDDFTIEQAYANEGISSEENLDQILP